MYEKKSVLQNIGLIHLQIDGKKFFLIPMIFANQAKADELTILIILDCRTQKATFCTVFN